MEILGTMIEIKYSQQNAQMGVLSGVLRVVGSMVYLKMMENSQSRQIVQQMEDRGAIVTKGNNNWVKIDMFKSHMDLGQTTFKLSGEEFDIIDTPINEVEKKIAKFFVQNFEKAKYICIVKENDR